MSSLTQNPAALQAPEDLPSHMKAFIHDIANYVARNGLRAELRLRSKSNGRLLYPFLFLDHKHTLYYQQKLREAIADVAIDHEEGYITSQSLSRLQQYTYGELVGQSSTTNASSATVQADSTPTWNDIPYGLLQEVHVIDEHGDEVPRPSTFIVIDNTINDPSAISNGNPLYNHMITSPVTHPKDHEPMYRLRPDTSITYRAPHSRLLPVGFQLGQEVVVATTSAGKGEETPITDKATWSGIVVRRSVVGGNRVYDVKDTHGQLITEIPEGRLNEAGEHTRGFFPFRLPH